MYRDISLLVIANRVVKEISGEDGGSGVTTSFTSAIKPCIVVNLTDSK